MMGIHYLDRIAVHLPNGEIRYGTARRMDHGDIQVVWDGAPWDTGSAWVPRAWVRQV